MSEHCTCATSLDGSCEVHDEISSLKARLAEAERDADNLLRRLNLDPERYRTECGYLNVPKIISAIKHPDEYPRLTDSAPAEPLPPGTITCPACEIRVTPNKDGLCPICDKELADSAEPAPEKCPDALLPDGPTCPRCGGRRGPSGIDGGSWVHY